MNSLQIMYPTTLCDYFISEMISHITYQFVFGFLKTSFMLVSTICDF